MTTWALSTVTALYVVTAIDLYRRGDIPLAWAFFAYSLANLGFIAAAIRS